MKQLLAKLQAAYPHLTFTPGTTAVWSPETQEVFYRERGTENNEQAATEKRDMWSLLHETGHALLGHTRYQADFELIKLEMAAWRKAKELATQFKIVIDEDHIEDCLDTYRDWLHARSICPTCTTKCLQSRDFGHYRCHNCHTTWRVTPSRFARPYRTTKGVSTPVNILHPTQSI